MVKWINVATFLHLCCGGGSSSGRRAFEIRHCLCWTRSVGEASQYPGVIYGLIYVCVLHVLCLSSQLHAGAVNY